MKNKKIGKVVKEIYLQMNPNYIRKWKYTEDNAILRAVRWFFEDYRV